MANIDDKFIKSVIAPPTKLSSSMSASSDFVAVESMDGWTSDTAVLAAIDRVDSLGNLTPDKMEIVLGVVSETGLSNVKRGIGGNVQSHSAGSVVELSIAGAEQWNRAMDALIGAFGQDGKLKESAFASGQQVVDGANIKDGSIEPGKLKNPGDITGVASNTTAGEQTWTPNQYIKKNGSDLTFTTTRPNQKVVFLCSAQFFQGGYSGMRVKVDGSYTKHVKFRSGIAEVTTASQTLMVVYQVPQAGTHTAHFEFSAGASGLRVIDGEGSANYAVFPALG